jgi:hypothetical protein
MYKIIILLFTAVLLYGCNSSKITSMNTSQNILNKKEKNNGWELLFDGKTTNGWHTYGKKTIGKAWKVEDGTLRMDSDAKKSFTTNEGGDIVTDEEFDNFHLQLDWKLSKNGNSGIMFFVNENPVKYAQAYYTGPEMQILDNAGHADAKIYKHKAGDLYDLIASSKDASKPIGEWNHVEIISNNGKLDFHLNNEHIVSTTLWDDNWRKMIAASKFKAWPDFGTFKKGKIDLQDHGDNIWFRNIKIKRL